jgi:glycosyltransferase involved in cell wall biosynthesis
MASNKVAIIIPAFNEASSIGRVIEELICVVGQENKVVVVNDCSTDDTSRIAENSGAHVVELLTNHGYAQAINQGLAYATSKLNVDYLVTMDADGQHDPKSVKSLIKFMISSDADLVVGQRAYTARISEWLYSIFYKKFFKIDDPLCGLKGYRKSVYLEYGKFETFDSIGTELLTISLIEKKRIEQIAIIIHNRHDLPRFGSGWSVNKRITLSLIKTIIFIANKKFANFNR